MRFCIGGKCIVYFSLKITNIRKEIKVAALNRLQEGRRASVNESELQDLVG